MLLPGVYFVPASANHFSVILTATFMLQYMGIYSGFERGMGNAA